MINTKSPLTIQKSIGKPPGKPISIPTNNVAWQNPVHRSKVVFTGTGKNVITKNSNHYTRPVVKISKYTGQVVSSYDSMTEAALDVGVSISMIYNCCNNIRPQCREYYWEYTDNYLAMQNSKQSVNEDFE
jgi:hypothetical protein